MPVFELQKDAADYLGISATHIRTSQREYPDFPDCSHGYNTDEIKAWLDRKNRKGSDTTEKRTAIRTAIEGQKLREAKARADRLERLEEEARGNILRRDEFKLSVEEARTIARDRLLSLPQSLCRWLPKEYHQVMMEEGKKTVVNILEEMTRMSLSQLEE